LIDAEADQDIQVVYDFDTTPLAKQEAHEGYRVGPTYKEFGIPLYLYFTSASGSGSTSTNMAVTGGWV